MAHDLSFAASKRATSWTLGLVLAVAVVRPAAAALPDSEPDWADYRFAAGAGVSLGDPGWGTELGILGEAGARVQVARWLGAGLSFLQLSAGNNEGFPALKVRALELSGRVDPWRTSWLDPYLRVGALKVISATDGFSAESGSVSRWGMEGVVGLSVTAGPVAFGVDIRRGFTNRAWTMLGLHVELRMPRW